jgi:hypothetical protein
MYTAGADKLKAKEEVNRLKSLEISEGGKSRCKNHLEAESPSYNRNGILLIKINKGGKRNE